tara:strand:- start:197 stop:412 length:216 start_codon:yes stop_codon:yes gene_type:complete
MAEKAKSKQIVVENPPPPKKKKSTETSTGFPRDIQFLGEALVREANRINELELSLESLRKDIARVMGRMGL